MKVPKPLIIANNSYPNSSNWKWWKKIIVSELLLLDISQANIDSVPSTKFKVWKMDNIMVW